MNGMIRRAYVILMLATAPNLATAAEKHDDSALVAIDAAIQSIKQKPINLTCS